MIQETTNTNAAGISRICKRSDQPQIEINYEATLTTMSTENVMGQQHDRFQTESEELQPWTAVLTWMGLVSKNWNNQLVDRLSVKCTRY